MKKNTIQIIFSALVFVLLANFAMASDFPPWEAPADEAAKENPIASDKKALSDGAAIFNTQCVACHGATGKGDGAIPSADMSTKQFQAQSDGAIFYKLHTGRGAMPAFAALSDDDTWKLIHFLRTLGGDFKVVEKKKAKIFLNLASNDKGVKQVNARFMEVNGDDKKPAADIKVGVYVKRYFGLLPIGGNRIYTDKEGNICVNFPEDLPGNDASGNLDVIVQVEDMDYETIVAEENIDWGIAKPVYDFDGIYALWRTNDHQPWWMVFMFVGIGGGIWLVIFYVLLLIRKIKQAA